MPVEVIGIDHVYLAVRDLARSTRFYDGVMGVLGYKKVEGPIAPMMCASDDPEHATMCDRSSRCSVNVLWVRVRDAVTGALDGMTLADLVPLPGTPTNLSTTSLTGAMTPS